MPNGSQSCCDKKGGGDQPEYQKSNQTSHSSEAMQRSPRPHRWKREVPPAGPGVRECPLSDSSGKRRGSEDGGVLRARVVEANGQPPMNVDLLRTDGDYNRLDNQICQTQAVLRPAILQPDSQ